MAGGGVKKAFREEKGVINLLFWKNSKRRGRHKFLSLFIFFSFSLLIY